MFTAACLLVLGMVPVSPVVDDTADVIEINRYYDHDGKRVFQQLIFWDWREEEGAYRVFAWRMVKSREQHPVFDHWRGEYTLVFLDQGVLRRIRAPSLRETWTQYDPELLDRQFLSPNQRRGLANAARSKSPGR
jgi:hypothetical protein